MENSQIKFYLLYKNFNAQVSENQDDKIFIKKNPFNGNFFFLNNIITFRQFMVDRF